MSATPGAFTTLSIDAVACGDEVWLHVTGAVDLLTTTQLSDALRAAERDEPAVVGLDLSGLNFMDSSGVHLLLAANHRARLAGRRLVVSNPSDPVQRLLSVTGLERQIELVS